MTLRRALLALLICALAAPLAPAYYHFITYATRGPGAVMYASRFDLGSLPGRKLPFVIREGGPAGYAPGDSFAALVSQIRAAAQAWSGVQTSDLKLIYGGLVPAGSTLNTPHIEVTYEELPEGVLAMGGPIARLDPVTTPDGGGYIPVVKSLLVLPADLSKPRVRPIYTERFFLTLVHEFGHALGLQHSWAGSVMSTEITRTTTKYSPLGQDDIAGISALYPAAKFRTSLGSISGRVTLYGNPVHLASVVALTPTGPAVSALTSTDGSYRIDGLPAGSYYLYAQPLPPGLQGEPQPVNLELPADPGGRVLPGPNFDTQFYSLSATAVEAGKTTEEINFLVEQRRAQANLHSVQTYTFYTTEAVKPATMVAANTVSSLILFGYGMSTGQFPVPGLSVQLLHAAEPVPPNGVKAYLPAPSYVQVDVSLNTQSQIGHRHLVFNLTGETHVAPSALRIVQKKAPTITQVTQNADRTLTIEGKDMSAATRVWFDGVAGEVKKFENDQLTVAPPPGPRGHRSWVVASNPDGQSSLMMLGGASPAYTFDSPEVASAVSTALTLGPGAETVFEVNTANLKMTEASAAVSFGTSDISVLRVVALDGSKALVQVAISPNAAPGVYPASVVSGLQSVAATQPLTVVAVNRAPYVAMSRMQSPAGYPGGTLTTQVMNLPAITGAASISATIGGQPVQVLAFNADTGALQLLVPASLPAGPALMQLAVNGDTVLPALVILDAPPPQLLAAQTPTGLDLGPQNAPRPGDLIQLLVTRLPALPDPVDPLTFTVASGAVQHQVVSITPAVGRPGIYSLMLFLSQSTTPGAAVGLTLSYEGRTSNPISITVRQ